MAGRGQDMTGDQGDVRRIKFGSVDYRPQSVKYPCFVVGVGETGGRCTKLAMDLIQNVSEAHGEGRSPAALMLAESEKVPGDMVAVPTMERSPDNLDISWNAKSKVAVIDTAKLQIYKKIEIPSGSNWVVELYEDEDSVFGKVIGMALTKAQFFPKRKGTPRKKNATTPTPDQTKAPDSEK